MDVELSVKLGVAERDNNLHESVVLFPEVAVLLLEVSGVLLLSGTECTLRYSVLLTAAL